MFHGQGGFVELGHFDKHFIKNMAKKLHNYITTFWMQNLSQRWAQSGSFFPKIRAFFSIFKKGQGRPLSVNEYAPISLNIPKYPWILAQCSDHARLWICLVILNVQKALEDALVFKCVTVLYARITQSSEYDWIWLNMPQ